MRKRWCRPLIVLFIGYKINLKIHLTQDLTDTTQAVLGIRRVQGPRSITIAAGLLKSYFAISLMSYFFLSLGRARVVRKNGECHRNIALTS